jgi:hypothetical protein
VKPLDNAAIWELDPDFTPCASKEDLVVDEELFVPYCLTGDELGMAEEVEDCEVGDREGDDIPLLSSTRAASGREGPHVAPPRGSLRPRFCICHKRYRGEEYAQVWQQSKVACDLLQCTYLYLAVDARKRSHVIKAQVSRVHLGPTSAFGHGSCMWHRISGQGSDISNRLSFETGFTRHLFHRTYTYIASA